MSPKAPDAVVMEIVEAGRFLSARGWVPATSGNFSRRIDAGTIAITVSGADKGELRHDQVTTISLHAPLPAGVSAETPVHVVLYQRNPDVGAVLHTHSVAATVVSLAHHGKASLPLAGYELVKGMRGYQSHEEILYLPLFENTQDMNGLARDIGDRMTAAPGCCGFLLAGHGLYAWGATMREARRHIEALEFLLACELERGRYRP
ncbi:MAG: methylthioribulose 1-phosphate dehydratase [Rhodospirillaceae bacterium]|nr:methylthioribulose 1-phosphate dehydratase [Rhodospirillaceae bacterium]